MPGTVVHACSSQLREDTDSSVLSWTISWGRAGVGEREGDRKRQRKTERGRRDRERETHTHRQRERRGYEEMKTVSFKNRVPWLWFGSRVSRVRSQLWG